MITHSCRESLFLLVLLLTVGASGCARPAVGNKVPRLLTLYGGSAVDVNILRGAASWEENQRRTFVDARWDFFPDGTFRFTPGAAANLRSDWYPLTGVYTAKGEGLELHATRRSDPGDSISLVGFVSGLSRAPRLVVLEASTSGVSRGITVVSQPLVSRSKEPAREGWPPVPSTFAVAVEGAVAGEPFGPLAGVLTLRPPSEGDLNPLAVDLATEDLTLHGSLQWSSFLAATEPRVQLNSVTIEVETREIVARLLPGIKDLLGPSWVRRVVDPRIPDLGAMPDWVFARQGDLRLKLDGNRVSGEIEATGRGQQPEEVRFEARIEGVARAVESETPLPRPANPLAGEAMFAGEWQSDRLGRFRLEQIGASVRNLLTGADGAQLAGEAEGNILSFHWERAGRKGTGLYVALPDRQLMAGLLAESSGRGWQVDIVERIGEPGTMSTAGEATSREEVRDHGFDLVQQGRCLEAIQPLKRAWSLYRQDRDRPELWESTRDGSLITELNILTRLGVCHVQLRRQDPLLETLREYVRVTDLLSRRLHLRPQIDSETLDSVSGAVETLSRQLTSDLEKIEVLHASRAFFEELVDLLLQLKKPTEALVASEKARARAFIELLAADKPIRRVEGGRVVRAGASVPVTAAGLQGTVQRLKSTAVEYMLMEKKMVVWVITPQGKVDVAEVAVAREEVDGLVRDLLFLVGRGALGRGGQRPAGTGPEARQREILRRLYDLLIVPVDKHLPPRGERVVFVPQGRLFLVPFPALLALGGEYLVDRYVVATAPAIGVFDPLRPPAERGWEPEEVLVVGDPALPLRFAHLGSLQYAEKEAKEVAQRFRARPLLGQSATKKAVVAAMSRSRLIHVASHGLLEYGDEEHLRGALVLAAKDGDGLLTAGEIAAMRLDADLVVLSACDSGSGTITGDGVAGLARAFLTAGASGVVVSLWQVDDEATAFLMDKLYEELEKGGRAEALGRAMHATRKVYPDPALWAGFTFIGAEPL